MKKNSDTPVFIQFNRRTGEWINGTKSAGAICQYTQDPGRSLFLLTPMCSFQLMCVPMFKFQRGNITAPVIYVLQHLLVGLKLGNWNFRAMNKILLYLKLHVHSKQSPTFLCLNPKASEKTKFYTVSLYWSTYKLPGFAKTYLNSISNRLWLSYQGNKNCDRWTDGERMLFSNFLSPDYFTNCTNQNLCLSVSIIFL